VLCLLRKRGRSEAEQDHRRDSERKSGQHDVSSIGKRPRGKRPNGPNPRRQSGIPAMRTGGWWNDLARRLPATSGR
jgi:hypothetical protein